VKLEPIAWLLVAAACLPAQDAPRWLVGSKVFDAQDGNLVGVQYSLMSDSGFAISRRDPEDGSVVWSHREPGLGVNHSKYWHAVRAQGVGNSVFVLSHGSGGAFTVELDASDGSRRARHVLDR